MSKTQTPLNLIYDESCFSREDERDDRLFYLDDRSHVQHLDSQALATITAAIEQLVVEKHPTVLDLMASWDSHLPAGLEPAEVVGLGLNERELAENSALSRRDLHDLNARPELPYADASFDVVLNTVSVDYLTRPFEVFAEVARVLRPGGLHLVAFSNRFFPEKVVRAWRDAGASQRVMMVQDYFGDSGLFGPTEVFISRGLPRPADDRYAGLEIPSDPVYLVYAERAGAGKGRPAAHQLTVPRPAGEPIAVEERAPAPGGAPRCPHCQQPMSKWAVPQTPFTEWDNEFLYVCFNDACDYLQRGWNVMAGQGNVGFSYRQMYNPDKDTYQPMPVPSLSAWRESIVE